MRSAQYAALMLKVISFLFIFVVYFLYKLEININNAYNKNIIFVQNAEFLVQILCLLTKNIICCIIYGYDCTLCCQKG